jgi:hypothetical protein
LKIEYPETVYKIIYLRSVLIAGHISQTASKNINVIDKPI